MRGILRHRRLLLSAAALAVMLAALATAGYIYAQNQGNDNYTEKEGDDRVVAVVNGLDVTYGDVRKSPGYFQAEDTTLTEADAFRSTIVGGIDRFVLLAEINRRGLMPTEEEGLAFMAPHKKACAEQQVCQDLIVKWGETFDGHWSRVAPVFREDLGVTRLNAALLSDAGFGAEDGTNLERANALAAAKDKLRADAKIVWKDEDLKRYYEEALADESS